MFSKIERFPVSGKYWQWFVILSRRLVCMKLNRAPSLHVLLRSVTEIT